MIPEKAIKLLRKNGRDYSQTAVGILIGYGVFPQTNEGIAAAKKLIAESEKWVSPSDLPEYYDGIDSDLMVGRENDAIVAIRNTIKEFYGITPPSAGTTDFVDTSVPSTTEPKEKKKNKLQPKPYAKDNVDRWSRLTGYELDSLDDYTRDQIRALASKYGVKRYSSYKDKGKLIEAIKDTDGYQQANPQLVDTEIEEISSQEKSSEELTIKLPPAHYIQGTAGRWNPEFENDIDHAVYFAGKSPLPKGAKQREVLDWLKSLGLTFEQIHDHREAVLEKIRETIALPGVEEEYPYVYIDAVDQDFVIEDGEDDDDDNEIDPDLESKLDELLKPSKEELQEEDKSIADNITDTIKDVVGEADEDEDEEDPMKDADIDIQAIADGDEDEITDVAGKLTGVLNKPKKESSYTSNKKIFDSIIVNFGRLQATLDVVNSNLEKQNSLIKASIESQLATGELIVNQTGMLGEKFDLLLQQFERQNDIAKQQQENEKNRAAEGKLEGQRDAAGVSDFKNLLGGKFKSRGSKIAEYYKNKALRQLYRVLPKRLRSGIKKARNLRKLPGRMAGKVTSKVLNRSPQVVQRLARGVQAIRGAQTAARGAQALGGIRNIGGPARALFAGMEYGERKGQGQSEVQALAGTGGSLAGGAGGAVGGGAIGAGIGALLGGAIGFFFAGVGAAPGAIMGAKIGKVAGSLAGGWYGAGKGSELADSFTGADQVTGEHETGAGLTKPGTAVLHGTEAVIPRDAVDMSPMNTLGGIMLASTTEFINSAGAVAAPIAPTFKGMAAQMAKQYDVPSTVVQTNVGGSLPSLDKELKKVKEKRSEPTGEEFSGQEQDLLNTQDEDNFAEKLLKMIDPEGKFETTLKNINNRSPMMGPDDYDGTGIDGDLEGNIVNPMEGGVMEDYPGAKFGAPRDGGRRKHKGRDLVGPAGMKVVSALPGTVTSIIDVGKLPGGGWSKGIYVKHSNGMETRYLHVHPSVKVGDEVKAGQQIGKITVMDDISSVAHLHFEVIANGKHVDPEPIVRGSLKLSDIAGGKVPGLSVKKPKNPAEIESYSGTEASGETPTASPPSSMSRSQTASATPSNALVPGQRPDVALNREQHRIAKQTREAGRASGMEGMDLERHVASAVMNTPPTSTPTQTSSASKVGEQLATQNGESSIGMGDTIAAEYGAGFPKTPTWMKILEQDYQKNKNKPLNPGTPKPGRGMGDVWNPLASVDRGSEIASLSRYDEESESNVVLFNNQSSPMPSMPSPGGTEIIQMGGTNSAELLKNLMLQRLG